MGIGDKSLKKTLLVKPEVGEIINDFIPTKIDNIANIKA